MGIERSARSTTRDPSGSPSATGETRIPLTDAQREIWLAASLSREQNASFNLSQRLDIRGPLDTEVMRASLQALIDRHDALRTRMGPEGEHQYVASELPIEIPYIDLSQRQDDLTPLAQEEANEAFDLVKGPLARFKIIKLEPQWHRILLTAHHIVCDGFSFDILFKELGRCYSALIENRPIELESPAPFSKYALSQQDQRHKKQRKEAQEYWINQFEGGIPVLELPTDKPRPPLKTYNADRVSVDLDLVARQDIEALCREFGCTAFAVMFSALTAFLHRIAGQSDFAVGVAAAGQALEGSERTVGHCVHLLPFRVKLDPERPFNEYLPQVRDQLLDAFEHYNHTFGSLIQHLKVKRDPSRLPLLSVMFDMDATPVECDLPGLEVDVSANPGQFENLEQNLTVIERGGKYRLQCRYNSDLFESDRVEARIQEFETFLSHAVKNPETPMDRVPVLPPWEEETLARDWNATQQAFPDTLCLHDIIGEQAKRIPQSTAVECGSESLAYEDLERRAQSIAQILVKKGIEPGDLVAVCLDRSPDMIATLLGIMKAGAAYVPLDPVYPRERLAFMLEDSQAKILATEGALLDSLPEFDTERILLVGEESPEGPDTALPPSDPDRPAYVIYTSGSTGKPKGVTITQRNLVNFLASMSREPGMEAGDALLAVTTYCFDIAALELFLPLWVGGRVVIAERDDVVDGFKLKALLKTGRITVMQATPATFTMMLEAGWSGSPDLKILCGGEALPQSLVRRLFDRCQSLWNMYGPTETTIWSTIKRIRSKDEPVTIGRPIANTSIYILDKRMRPVPIGVAGDLYIGGEGVAQGYHKRPELTEERFLPDPFSQETSARIYNTGDMALYRPNGEIVFEGRMDHQVKIRGFRIELGEIENRLGEHPSVRQSVVVAAKGTAEDDVLVGYLVTQGEPPDIPELRRFLKAQLPDYMAPASFVVLEAMPLTPNGKVDRGALAAADSTRAGRADAYASPQDSLELQLTNIWAKHLNISPIGVHDDFFDLGGHSMIAVRIFAEIEAQTGITLPLATFFTAPTIEKLAALLRQEDWTPTWTSLVPIQPGGSKPPLFLVHGGGGNVLLYRDLSKRLGADQPVYGLQSKGLDGREPYLSRIEDMASLYIEEIRKFKPTGPYHLGGYCMGGTIAYEMAQQLTHSGEKVGVLAMLDTQFKWNAGETTLLPRIRHQFQRVLFHLANVAVLNPKNQWQFIAEKARESGRRIKRTIAVAATQSMHRLRLSKRQPLVDIEKINDYASFQYLPQPYAGRVTLFQPKAQYGSFDHPLLGWREEDLGEGLEHFELSAFPAGMLIEPYVDELAEKLSQTLERAHLAYEAALSEGASPSTRRAQPKNKFTLWSHDVLEKTPTQLFEAQVEQHGAKLALNAKRCSMTYEELNNVANHVARALLDRNLDTDRPIALLLSHDAPLIYGILGLWKAGHAYLGIDPTFPPARIAFMIEDSTSSLILTDNEYREDAMKIAADRIDVLNLDELDFSTVAGNPNLAVSSDQLSHIGYTSGSTGRPKGAIWTQRQVVHDAMIFNKEFHMRSEDRVTLLANCSAGAFMPDFCDALFNGGTLYPFRFIDQGPRAFIRFLIEERITVTNFVPAIFRALIGALKPGESFPDLRLLLVGGDRIYPQDIEDFMERFPDDCVMWTGLGATETGSVSNYFYDKESTVEGSFVPVGYAADDKEILLLDENGEKVGFDVVGELAVRSRYFSPGYWNRPELTEKAFRPDPDGGDKRIYMTGDLATMRPDGCLIHVGRKDNQVQILGFRVEIAEIETALMDHQDIKQAVVAAFEEQPGKPELVAYLIPENGELPENRKLREFLLSTLPGYMVPPFYVPMETFPFTQNGKVNRTALPKPDLQKRPRDKDFVPANTSTEKRLADIWSKVFALEEIGLEDDFFSLGGNSLMAIQIVSQTNETFGKSLPIRALFDHPTIAALTQLVNAEDPQQN